MAEILFYKGSGSRIKELRHQLGLSRKDMARRLGLSRPAYYKNESGDTFPGIPTLRLLEKEYDISMDWLMFGKGAMHYNQEKQRAAAMEKELAELKKEREQERENMSVKEKEMAGKLVIENKPGLAELFEWMDREPLLYHEVMVYFHKFKKEIGKPEETLAAEPPDSEQKN